MSIPLTGRLGLGAYLSGDQRRSRYDTAPDDDRSYLESRVYLTWGFDIALVRWLALSANFGTYVTALGDVRVGGTVVDDVIATIYEAGVGLTVR